MHTRQFHNDPALAGLGDGRFDAEYFALAHLHAGALIILDRQLAHVVKDLVTVAPIEAPY